MSKIFYAFAAVIFTAFVIFVVNVRREVPLSKSLKCDNIVVLTGGRNRIKFALNSVERFDAKNVFISGVHDKTTLKDILSDRNVEGVNIVLGHEAKSTKGNALEIRQFVRDKGIDQIVLVTSDYHMIRSVHEVKKYNKGLKVFPLKVISQYNFEFFVLCFKEFYRCAAIIIQDLFKGETE